MSVRTGRTLLGIGAVLMAITACMHAVGWFSLRSQFSGDMLPIVRLLWFSIDLDWLVVGAIWALAAATGIRAYRLPVFAASIIPIGAAIWLAVAVGPGFIGVYMLAAAAVSAVIGGYAVGRVSP